MKFSYNNSEIQPPNVGILMQKSKKIEKWLHIDFKSEESFLRPVMAALKKAALNGKTSPVDKELGDISIHIATKFNIIEQILNRINNEIKDLYKNVRDAEEEYLFTNYKKGYGYPIEKELHYNILIDIDALLFEINSCQELIQKFIYKVHLLSGIRIDQKDIGRKIKCILDNKNRNTDWFETLVENRNFFIQEGAPYFTVDFTNANENHFDLIIMKENLKNFDDKQKYLKLSELKYIVNGFNGALTVIKEYLIHLIETNRIQTAAVTVAANSYIEKLTLTNPLREPVIRSAINTLQLPAGSRGLDAGCGIGFQALLLLEAVEPGGHVTCLDLSSEFLSRADKILTAAGRAEQVSFRQGDINKLPFGDNSFDWVWSADCAGYPAREPLSFVDEFVRVVKPGGFVAIFIYSSQNLLPGYPLLEARLNDTTSGIAPFDKDMKPELHSLRALGWLRKAGLKDLRAKTFASGFHAPLTDEIREGLGSLLQMRWINVEPELSREDREEYRRLCLPESPDFILNLPDYYAFFTYSLFWGKVSK